MSTETEVIRDLFAAASGVRPDGGMGGDLWPDFLKQLGGVAGAGAVALHYLPDEGGTRSWHIGTTTGSVPPGLRQMRFDRVYSQVDMPGMDDRNQPLRALKCAAGANAVAVLELRREGRDFRAVDGVQLSGLVPYLGQALISWRALVRERARAALDRGQGGDLGAGWVIFSPMGSVIEMAPQARDWLERLAGARLRASGRLDFPASETAPLLRQAISGSGGPRRVELLREPAMDMLLNDGVFDGEAVVIGHLRRDMPARGIGAGRIAAAFDLSRSEARLAMLICDGFSLRDAAMELGWTLETARSCSKQIFARMGVSGQTGVLRKIANSAVWLG
ncbi:MAG: helix-turn-helix transcriptional regulator [Tropicimonas sp.]|uniref:helix-turn-helix transcriptional regulator n=1 Tax=Tropicimonas sp. TaxID=2067044 RepID=UPI003A85CCBF